MDAQAWLAERIPPVNAALERWLPGEEEANASAEASP